MIERALPWAGWASALALCGGLVCLFGSLSVMGVAALAAGAGPSASVWLSTLLIHALSGAAAVVVGGAAAVWVRTEGRNAPGVGTAVACIEGASSWTPLAMGGTAALVAAAAGAPGAWVGGLAVFGVVLPRAFGGFLRGLLHASGRRWRSALALGASPLQVVAQVALPAGAPGTLASALRSLSVALGAAAPLAVLGLWLGDHSTLALAVFDAAALGQTDEVAAHATLLLLVIVALHAAASWVESRELSRG